MSTFPYDRSAALAYAARWAYDRNPRFTDFALLGGDCTNFISQCLLAGGGVMDPRETFGWYYVSLHRRAPAWSGVPYLWNYLTSSHERGPYGHAVQPEQLELGDIIQLGDGNGRFYHSLLVTRLQGNPLSPSISVTTHDQDAHQRPLSSYIFKEMRCLHIDGVKNA